MIVKEFDKKYLSLNRTPDIVFTYHMQGQIIDGKHLKRNSFIEEFHQIVSQ